MFNQGGKVPENLMGKAGYLLQGFGKGAMDVQNSAPSYQNSTVTYVNGGDKYNGGMVDDHLHKMSKIYYGKPMNMMEGGLRLDWD